MENQTRREYLFVEDERGLVSLAQMGVLEIHPWGSRVGHLEEPDRMILDLDPGPGVSWPRVIEGARRLRSMLDQLKLVSFVKTTGGKGFTWSCPSLRVRPGACSRSSLGP